MTSDIAMIPLQILALLYAVVIHEWAHGYAAFKMGDKTAYYMGRLTLNPIKHIDLFGTILLPLFMIIVHSPVLFGWAKPVPVNPNNYTDYKKGEIVVSLAGVTANIASAILFTILAYILMPFRGAPMYLSMMKFFVMASVVNVILFAFNLIPIPPLDGSHVMMRFLSPKAAYNYSKIAPYGFFIVIALLYLNVIDVYLVAVIRLYSIVTHLPIGFLF